MQLLVPIVDHRRPDGFARRFRTRRFQLFRSLISSVRRPLRILDVGGTELFWQQMAFTSEPEVTITTLNLDPPHAPSSPNVRVVQGDARDMHAFADQSFDVAFSNSLIEHVGGPDDQRRCADEIRRVGQRFFVQTPNRGFPLEPHFVFPFFQHLPVPARVYLVTHFRMGWLERQGNREEARKLVESIRLLDRRRVQELFPGATIWEERVLGLVKSLVAYGGFPPPA